jgi:hypothetical protein
MIGNIMAHQTTLSFVLAVVCALPLCGATVTIQPDPLFVAPGATVWAEVFVGDLDGAILGGFDLRFLYPDALSISDSPEFGSLLGNPDSEAITLTTVEVGRLRLLQVSLLSEDDLRVLQQTTDPFVLARIPFTTPVAAHGRLHVFGELTDAAGLPVAATDRITPVTGIPEPSTMALASVLLIVAALRPRAVLRR